MIFPGCVYVQHKDKIKYAAATKPSRHFRYVAATELSSFCKYVIWCWPCLYNSWLLMQSADQLLCTYTYLIQPVEPRTVTPHFVAGTTARGDMGVWQWMHSNMKMMLHHLAAPHQTSVQQDEAVSNLCLPQTVSRLMRTVHASSLMGSCWRWTSRRFVVFHAVWPLWLLSGP